VTFSKRNNSLDWICQKANYQFAWKSETSDGRRRINLRIRIATISWNDWLLPKIWRLFHDCAPLFDLLKNDVNEFVILDGDEKHCIWKTKQKFEDYERPVHYASKHPYYQETLVRGFKQFGMEYQSIPDETRSLWSKVNSSTRCILEKPKMMKNNIEKEN